MAGFHINLSGCLLLLGFLQSLPGWFTLFPFRFGLLFCLLLLLLPFLLGLLCLLPGLRSRRFLLGLLLVFLALLGILFGSLFRSLLGLVFGLGLWRLFRLCVDLSGGEECLQIVVFLFLLSPDHRILSKQP